MSRLFWLKVCRDKYQKPLDIMKQIIHRAATRGHADHGWLDTWHTFSFAGYFDRQRMHFGELRVLNDDTVAPLKGFDAHPHENMEIVSIPLEGELKHRDSMGSVSVIQPGQIQVMTAGTGVVHSEYNNRADGPVKFLQIWVFPTHDSLQPRYEDVTLAKPHANKLRTLVTPKDAPEPHTGWMNQHVWFHTVDLHKHTFEYPVRRQGNGVYVFVLWGSVLVEGEKLGPRDGMGLWETPLVHLEAGDEPCRVLLIDVPMTPQESM